jgi:hypothetical protein
VYRGRVAEVGDEAADGCFRVGVYLLIHEAIGRESVVRDTCLPSLFLLLEGANLPSDCVRVVTGMPTCAVGTAPLTGLNGSGEGDEMIAARRTVFIGG